jgi:hypothetical protein
MQTFDRTIADRNMAGKVIFLSSTFLSSIPSEIMPIRVILVCVFILPCGFPGGDPAPNYFLGFVLPMDFGLMLL